MEPTLEQVLEELVLEVDDLHEIIKGIDLEYIKSWNTFIQMHEDDLPTRTKLIARVKVPLSSNAIRIVSHIKQLIWKNMIDEMPGARLASTYAKKI